ncbi:HIT-like domain-containing protein [Mycena olivaceomarginata]|nr:HIT-like domain-containing protein [Mycena olivaceomarginata]
MAAKNLATCLFCKIIKGASLNSSAKYRVFKLIETELSFSFLDIGPLSKGHALVIPKHHAEKLHQLPDEYLADALPIAKKIAIAQGAENYNVLQNNGRLAHQVSAALPVRPGTIGATPDPAPPRPLHLGHLYAPRPIPAAHPSYSPVSLPFPSIAEGGLQVRVMPRFQCSRIAPHLPLRWRYFPHSSGCAALAAHAPGGCHCIPVRYAARISTIAPSCGDAGSVGAALSALAPHLLALPQKHNTPANVNRDSSRSPALRGDPCWHCTPTSSGAAAAP